MLQLIKDCRGGGAWSNATDSRSAGLGLREFNLANKSLPLHLFNLGDRDGFKKNKKEHKT